jgi:phosphatidyl-myo-inositol alpha-mannosyltransferase
MKIGLVCPYNLFKGGGVQECVLALQAELSSRGHQVLIITPQPRHVPAVLPQYIRTLGRSTDVKSPFHTTAQISVSVDPRQVDALFTNEQFDILHFHEPWVPLLAWQLLRRSKTKNVATFHAKLPESMVSKTIERVVTPYTKSLLKYLDSLTAVSDAAAEYVQSLSTKQINIIPNGIDLQKYKSAPNNNRNPDHIVYIGRLERRKGIQHLLKSFAILKQQRPGLKLTIAGDGPDREKLVEWCQTNHITDATFTGYIDEAEKLRLLHNASLFVSPALYGESFGIVLLEAMAVGLPIVAGNNPGYSSVLKGRGQLSLINPKDHQDFAKRMELLLDDKDLRSAWQKWAGSHISQFDYGKVVDEYEKLYKKVAHS